MPGGPVIGVVDPAVRVDDDLGILGQDGIGPERADLADEQLAEREVVGECPVRLVEEADPGIADDLGAAARCSASRVAASGERVEVGVLTTLVAARAAHEPADRAGVDPARGGRGRAEVGVVRVGDDDHEPGRPPVVGGRGRAASPAAASVVDSVIDRECRRDGSRAGTRRIGLHYGRGPVQSWPRLRSSPPTGEASLHARRPSRSPRQPAAPNGPHRPSPRRARRGPRRRGRRPSPAARPGRSVPAGSTRKLERTIPMYSRP